MKCVILIWCDNGRCNFIQPVRNFSAKPRSTPCCKLNPSGQSIANTCKLIIPKRIYKETFLIGVKQNMDATNLHISNETKQYIDKLGLCRFRRGCRSGRNRRPGKHKSQNMPNAIKVNTTLDWYNSVSNDVISFGDRISCNYAIPMKLPQIIFIAHLHLCL